MSWKYVQRDTETGQYRTTDQGGGGGTVTDVQVDGVSVVNQQGVAEIPAIPDGLHHYSTTEHVIGTWIDGSTLYERTFVFDPALSLPYNTWVDSDYVLGSGWKIIYNSCIDIFNANMSAINVTPYSSNGKVAFMNIRNNTSSLAYAVLQYTKT